MTPLSVIFDIDGVVVDSEQLHFDVLKSLLPEQTQGVLPENLIGLSLEQTLLKIGIAAAQHNEIVAQVVSVYKAALGPRYLRPGIQSLTQSLIAQHIPFGFVSTAPADICLANLATLGHSQALPLISGDDIARTKPFPDPYLAMLHSLGVRPEHTIVIEDTDLGIQSATRAGIDRVYGWPHALSGSESYTGACKVIHSLNEIEALQGCWLQR